MTVARTLPFTPIPQLGESPLSVLRRGALGNGHLSTLRFAFALNPSLDHAPTALGTLARSPILYRDTCRAMGLTDEEIDRVAYGRVGAAREDDIRWLGLEVGVGEVQFRRQKLCMACYQQFGYALAEWDHVAAAGCKRHGSLLDDQCPCCARPWTHIDDPLACGCPPAEVIRRQRPCPADAAALLSELVSARDQDGIRLLAKLHETTGILRRWCAWPEATSTACALLALHQGRWPEDLGRVAATGQTLLHPRILLAPLLADKHPHVRAHARQLLHKAAPKLGLIASAEQVWPASVAMAVLGIGRVPFAKLVTDGHLRLDAVGQVSVFTVNALLHLLSTDKLSTLDIKTQRTVRAGGTRNSLSAAATELIMSRRASAGSDAHYGLGSMRCGEDSGQAPSMPALSISVVEASQRLNTNTEAVRGIVRVGLLPAKRGDATSGVRWCIDPDALEAFDAEYVFGPALARQYAVTRTTMSSRLQSAGIAPISGPGIDIGVTFLFRREDLKNLDIRSLLDRPYRSTAGRKKKIDSRPRDDAVSTHRLAVLLGVSPRHIRQIVRDQWISAVDPDARRLSFDRSAAQELLTQLTRYRDITEVAATTGQSRHAFRRTWITTGYVQVRRLGDRVLMLNEDVTRIIRLWGELGTSSDVGRALGRHRSVCPNLQKMGELPPAMILGTGTRKVRLYCRKATPLIRMQLQASGARVKR